MSKSYYPFKLIKYKLGDLQDFEQNPVQLSERAAKKLAEQLKRGQDLPYVAAAPKNGKHGLPLLDGHQRKHVELTLNHKSPETLVPVLVPSRPMTEREKKQWIIEHRKNTGEFDNDGLLNWYERDDLMDWGFTEKELEFAGFEFEDKTQDAEPQIDRAAELLKKWKVQTGDLWQIGEHRLICGDCTDAAVVARVMGGEKATLLFTDPPYGVSIGAKNRMLNSFQKAGRNLTDIESDQDSTEDLGETLLLAFTLIKDFLSDDCSVFVCSPQGGSLGLMMMMMMRDAGLEIRHVLNWVKNSPTFSVGRLDYEYQHEPILFTWVKTHKRYKRGFTTSTWNVDKPRHNADHPTIKPIELPTNAMLNHTDEGDVVIDNFVGSGTTLVACQNLARRGRAIEISPAYVAVTLERMHTAFPELEIRRVK